MILSHSLVEAETRAGPLDATECLSSADDLVDFFFLSLYDSVVKYLVSDK
jgi:hypothetical protein